MSSNEIKTFKLSDIATIETIKLNQVRSSDLLINLDGARTIFESYQDTQGTKEILPIEAQSLIYTLNIAEEQFKIKLPVLSSETSIPLDFLGRWLNLDVKVVKIFNDNYLVEYVQSQLPKIITPVSLQEVSIAERSKEDQIRFV